MSDIYLNPAIAAVILYRIGLQIADNCFCTDENFCDEHAAINTARKVIHAQDEIVPELLKIARAYRNLLKTMAHTDGEVATYHHIDDLINKIEKVA